MLIRKKVLEERIGAAIRAEFAGSIAELERNLQEFRHRLKLKETARDTLERAEAEARRVHNDRIALKKRFWKAYYGKDEDALSKIGPMLGSLERAVKKAEKALGKARVDFEKVDFNEVAEGAALREKAEAAREKADLRIAVIEETLEHALAETWREVKEASEALRDECGELRYGTSEEETARERSA
jgi:hypothetical protein